MYQEGPARVDPIATFKDAGLHPAMLKNVELAGYDTPTPIQRYCLPAIHLGHDVIGIAQTGKKKHHASCSQGSVPLISPDSSGSGKTAAYLIPILNKLMGKAKKLAAPRPNPATFQEGVDTRVRAEPLVVIVVPTRELAVQIFNEARKFCYRTMLRPCVVYGGGAFQDQAQQLQKGCDILVASPGRLVAFMNEPRILTLRRVRYMVIDEADEMLDDDWKEELDTILSGGGKFPHTDYESSRDLTHEQSRRKAISTICSSPPPSPRPPVSWPRLTSPRLTFASVLAGLAAPMRTSSRT